MTEQPTESAVKGWRMYYGDAWVPSDPPPPDLMVQWKRLGTEQSFVGKSADFDPALNVSGLMWRPVVHVNTDRIVALTQQAGWDYVARTAPSQGNAETPPAKEQGA